MSRKTRQLISSISWNLFLIAAGAAVFAVGVKAVVVPHGLITGGITGVSLLCYYLTGVLTPGQWYFVITENTFNVYGKGFSRRKVY
jgi:uncharacterized membrane-anchored protein YitT (DUF2179 family)